jgi:hypothetical protein
VWHLSEGFLYMYVIDRKKKMGKKPSKGEREEGRRRSYLKKKERKYEGERENLFNKIK